MLRVDDIGTYMDVGFEHAGDLRNLDAGLRQHWAHVKDYQLCMNWIMVNRLSGLLGLDEPVGEVDFPTMTMTVVTDATMRDNLVRIR